MTGTSAGTRSLIAAISGLVIACGLTAWALFDARFRDAGGTLSGSACLPISIGVAAGVLIFSFPTGWRRTGAWLALAISGNAAGLQMIDAGRQIGYQHLKAIPGVFNSSPETLAIFALQVILVSTGLIMNADRIRRIATSLFRPWQVALFCLIIFVTAATVSRTIGDYLIELPSAALIQFVNLINILLAVMALPESAIEGLKFNELLSGSSGESAGSSGSLDGFAIAAAGFVIVAAALLNQFSYQRHPHVADEVVYLLHARYFAEGRLDLPAPPVKDAFYIDLMDYEADRWFSPVPPGWPAMLSLGALLGIPWLVNPVLGGILVLLTWLLIGELYDRRTARLTILLLCLSPWHLFMSMNYMTHTMASVCAVGGALAIALARRSGRAGWALVGGLAAGLVGAIRPLEGLIVAGLLGLWAIGIGGKRLKPLSIAAFIIGGLIIGGLLLPYNKYLTGSATKFPIMAYTDKYFGSNSNAMGFGADRGLGWALDPNPGHGPVDALINSNLNITSINTELFGWGCGSLLLLALISVKWGFKDSDYLMLALIAATYVAHFFYWFSGGPDFGARYWYLMLIPCIVLSVRGLQMIGESGDDLLKSPRPVLMAVALSLIALVNFVPWRAIDKYHHYLGMSPDIRDLVETRRLGRSLVLIRGNYFPEFASAAVYNPLDLEAAAPVFAWDKNPVVRRKTLEHYLDRPVWIIEGPSVTGHGYRISDGPVSASSLTGNSE